jgi:hypothetical protein
MESPTIIREAVVETEYRCRACGHKEHRSALINRGISIMPKDELIHIDDPTFEKVRAVCKRLRTFVSVPLKAASISCRVGVKGNNATFDFDMYRLGSNLSDTAQVQLREQHGDYIKRTKRRFTRSPMYSSFGPTGMHFSVLEEDASEWFDRVYHALLDDSNFSPIPSPFDFLESIWKPAEKLTPGKGSRPVQRSKEPPGPPTDSPGQTKGSGVDSYK